MSVFIGGIAQKVCSLWGADGFYVRYVIFVDLEVMYDVYDIRSLPSEDKFD